MTLLASVESRYGWGGPFEPWEIHPALNHLAIAFLLSAVVLDLYAWWRGRPGLTQVAAGLLIAGVLAGVATALAGLLAFFTVPAHTELAHKLMYWHLGIQVVAILLFGWPAWKRWRNWGTGPTAAQRCVGLLAAILLSVGSAIGGYLVYHGGAGIEPELLTPEVRQSHSHAGGSEGSQPAPPSESHHEHDHDSGSQ